MDQNFSVGKFGRDGEFNRVRNVMGLPQTHVARNFQMKLDENRASGCSGPQIVDGVHLRMGQRDFFDAQPILVRQFFVHQLTC